MNACRLATLPLATWEADRRKSRPIRLVQGARMTTRTQQAARAYAEMARRGRKGYSQHPFLPAGAMSDTTKRVWRFIKRYKKRNHDLYPMFREIQESCGLSSTSVAHYQVGLLVRYYGKLERRGHRYVLAEEAL